MQVVEKSGKTVEEAVAAALEELQTTRDKVQVEVVTEPKKSSLFGLIGGRDAKVKVTVVEEAAPVQAEAETAPVAVEVVAESVEEVVVVQSATKAEPEPASTTAPVDKEVAAQEREAAVAAAKAFLQGLFAKMKMNVMMEKFYDPEEEGVQFKLHGPGMGVLIGKHGQTLDSLQYLTNLVANKHTKERVRIIIDVEDYRKRRRETLVRLAERLADKVKRTGEKVALEPMNPYERKIIHMTLQNDRSLTTYSEGDEPYRKVVITLK